MKQEPNIKERRNIERKIRKVISDLIQEGLTTERIKRGLRPYPQERIDRYVENNTNAIETAVTQIYDYYMEFYPGYGSDVDKYPEVIDMISVELYEALPELYSRETGDQAESDDEYPDSDQKKS